MLLALQLQPARADEIVMRNGERFGVSAIWDEGDKIRFDMQGLVVSVEKAEVAAVIRSDSKALPNLSADPRPLPQRPLSAPLETQKQSLQIIEEPPPERSVPRRTASRPAHEATKINPSKTSSGHRKGMDIEGVSWGMSPNSLRGLAKLKTDPLFGGIDQYWRPDHPMIFGQTPLDGWVFGFWKDQLYTILMWTEGRKGYDRMKNEVFSRYGLGIRSKLHDERYVWMAEDTQHMLEFDVKLNTGLFVMRSSQMDDRIKKLYPPDQVK